MPCRGKQESALQDVQDTGKMTQQLEELIAESEPEFKPRTRVKVGENSSCKDDKRSTLELPSDHHMCVVTCMYHHQHTHTHKINNNVMKFLKVCANSTTHSRQKRIGRKLDKSKWSRHEILYSQEVPYQYTTWITQIYSFEPSNPISREYILYNSSFI